MLVGGGFWQEGRSLPIPVASDTAGKGAINPRSSLSGFSGAYHVAQRGLRGAQRFATSAFRQFMHGVIPTVSVTGVVSPNRCKTSMGKATCLRARSLSWAQVAALTVAA